MSSRNNNARSNTRSAPTPFCKVCMDAGKSKQEYTSHWVKSNDRLTGTMIITCPTLLSQECRYCHEFGHTAKYCHSLADKIKYDEKEPSSHFADKKKDQKVADKKATFDVLAYDSSDEEKQVKQKSKPKPVVVAAPKPVTTAAKPVLTGWAAIAAKPVQDAKPAVQPASVFTELRESFLNAPVRSQPSEGFGLTPQPAWVPPVLTRSETLGRPAASRGFYTLGRKQKNWADDTSSDEEDEDELFNTPKVVSFENVPPTRSWSSISYNPGAYEDGYEYESYCC